MMKYAKNFLIKIIPDEYYYIIHRVFLSKFLALYRLAPFKSPTFTLSNFDTPSLPMVTP